MVTLSPALQTSLLFVTASLSTLMPRPVSVASAHLLVTDASGGSNNAGSTGRRRQLRVVPEPECAMPALPATAPDHEAGAGASGRRIHPRDVVQYVFRVRLPRDCQWAWSSGGGGGAGAGGAGHGSAPPQPQPLVQARLVVAYTSEDGTRELAGGAKEASVAADGGEAGAGVALAQGAQGRGSWASDTVPLAPAAPVDSAASVMGASALFRSEPAHGARMVTCAAMEVGLADVPDRLRLNHPANVRAVRWRCLPVCCVSGRVCRVCRVDVRVKRRPVCRGGGYECGAAVADVWLCAPMAGCTLGSVVAATARSRAW